MKSKKRDTAARAMRIAACLLMLAAAGVSGSGRLLGRDMVTPVSASRPSAPSHISPVRSGFRISPRGAASLAVLAAAAFLPLRTKRRSLRTAQLWLDIAILGLWSGEFLSTARLVAWSSAGLPREPVALVAALLMLAMAFLWPVFGRKSHYCLWVCPFGAAQELAGRLAVRKLRLSPGLVRVLTSLRRIAWGVLMLSAWCLGCARWVEWELMGVFAASAVAPVIVVCAIIFLALSIWTPRPYCRFVCPTGSLLKLSESTE